MNPAILSLLLGILGLASFVFGVYLKGVNVASTAKFSALVKATVVGLKNAGPFDHGRPTYFPTVRFNFEGKAYRTTSKEFVSSTVKIGDTFSVFVDPHNPHSIRLVKSGETVSSIAAKVFGVVMLGLAIFSYYL